MSRNASGTYTLPPEYVAEAGATILANQHNSPLEDLQTDANTPRPVTAGGTGAASAETARSNLSVYSISEVDTGFTKKVTSRAALKALDTATQKACVLTEASRQKLFMWETGDFTAAVAGDPNEYSYIPADGVAASLGCWVAVTGAGASIISVAQGGTGASNVSDARTNLGLAIGTDVQAHNAVLDATTASYTTAEETKLAGIEAGADVTDAANVAAAGAAMTANNLSDLASAATARTNLGLAIGTNVQAADANLDTVAAGGTAGYVLKAQAGGAVGFEADSGDASAITYTRDGANATQRQLISVINEGAYNVRDAGYDPAASDFSAMFAKAFSDNNYRGRFYIPAGVYPCTDTAFNLVDRYNMEIFGDGAPTSPNHQSSGITTIMHRVAGKSAVEIDGCQGIRIHDLEIAYNDITLIGTYLVRTAQILGAMNTSDVEFDHFRVGGDGVGNGTNGPTAFGLYNCYDVSVRRGSIDRVIIGVLGADNTQFANRISVEEIFFGRSMNVCVRAGGHTWNQTRCTHELRFDNVVSAFQTTNAGIDSLNYVGNHHDDGSTTGTWFIANGAPIRGGLIAGNWFRNGANAIDLQSSKGVTITGNRFWALENAAPIAGGSATHITALGNDITTDSGINIPGLFSTLPTGDSIFDNVDGVGVRVRGGMNVTNKLVLNGPGFGVPHLQMANGAGPASAVDGDMWFDGATLKFRVGGVNKTISWT